MMATCILRLDLKSPRRRSGSREGSPCRRDLVDVLLDVPWYRVVDHGYRHVHFLSQVRLRLFVCDDGELSDSARRSVREKVDGASWSWASSVVAATLRDLAPVEAAELPAEPWAGP